MADQDQTQSVLAANLAGRIGASLKTTALEPGQKKRLRDQLMGSIKGGSKPLFIVRAEEGEWVDMAPGIEIKQLYREPDGPFTTSLWRVQPGAGVEAHPHGYDEECLVLEGEIMVGGVSLRAGDYIVGQTGVDHPEVYSPGGALLLIRTAEIPPPAQESRPHA